MTFDDIQVLWDAQRERPRFEIDTDSLHRRVREKRISVERALACLELPMAMLFLVMAIAVGQEPLREGHDWHQLFDAALYLFVAGFLIVGRIRRGRDETTFDDSLRGDLDRAIAQCRAVIGRLRSVVWWMILPIVATTAVSFSLFWDQKPVWIWPALLLCLSVTFISTRNELTRRQLPLLAELTSLRDRIDGEW